MKTVDTKFNLYVKFDGELDCDIDVLEHDNTADLYWEDKRDLDDIVGWDMRYEYESKILLDVINSLNIKKVLEFGSGPGGLADKVLNLSNDLSYHMIDGKSAKKEHDNRNYKGQFFVKNLKDSFEYSDLETDYELIVSNDFLEHIRNPSLLLTTIYDKLTTSNSYYFCSSPNWRTKHGFYYPGLFDYDNLIKFFMIHKYQLVAQFPSWANHVPIKCPRLDSEQTVAEEKLHDWNYYLLFKKITK